MRYATPTAFRQALDDRIKAEAIRTGLSETRLRKRVAFELFLRRLAVVAPDRWVLKGAFALELRFSAAARSTKDIDVGHTGDVDRAVEDLAAAQQLQLDDLFTFAVHRAPAFDQRDDLRAIRFQVKAEVAGRLFDQFPLDVGFSGSRPWPAESIETFGFLSFAGIEPIKVSVLPLDHHVAEKVHAYTRRYGKAERDSSRPKDLVDILLIGSLETLEAASLRQAIVDVFEERAQQPLPTSLPPPPRNWEAPYRRLASEVGVEPNLANSFARVAAFLDPVLAGLAAGKWDPRRFRWG